MDAKQNAVPFALGRLSKAAGSNHPWSLGPAQGPQRLLVRFIQLSGRPHPRVHQGIRGH